MQETAKLPYFGPLPWLGIGALLGIALFGMPGIGALVLTVVGVGIAAKMLSRWRRANGQPAGFATPWSQTPWSQTGGPTGWPSCGGFWKRGSGQPAEPPPSGNHAFDDYRREMLRRLEQDHTDFQSFLDRLRRAKDKAEFDQFMADRGHPESRPESRPEPRPNA